MRTKDVRVTHKAVLAHIAKARSIKNLEVATLVFCFESNLAFESQHLIHAIQEAGVKKWIALTEGAGNTLGWLTTNERKESMMFNLRDAMAVGSIHFSNEFFCLSQGVREMKQQLEDELRNYCVLVEPSKTPFGKSARALPRLLFFASCAHGTPSFPFFLLSPQPRRRTPASWEAATTTSRSSPSSPSPA